MSATRTESLVKISIDSDSDMQHDEKKVASFNFRRYDSTLSSLKPLHHSSDIFCKLREDIVTRSLSQYDAVDNAAKSKKGYVVSIRSIPPEES